MRIRRFRARPKRSWKFWSRRSFWKKTGWSFLGLGILFLGSCFIYGAYFLPPVDQASELSFAESTIIYDRKALDEGENPDDHILYVIHGDENREYIPLKEISPWLKKATIAIEDDGFYSHFGFDIGGTAKGLLNHFFGVGTRRGGSTITQQLVKNAFLSRERSVTRKFNELLLSVKVEWHYSKDKILELYLNKIPYGHNAHGAEAAAKTFFGKSARELSLAESVILASLPVAPTRFSPYGANRNLLMGYNHYDEATGKYAYRKGRKDLVLQRMLDLEMITFEEFKTAWAEAKNIDFKRARTDIKAPHFVFYVRERLEEKYGESFLKQGGLRIFTTLDPDLQDLANEIIQAKSAHYPDTYGAHNVALSAIEVGSGQILAHIGGKNFFDEESDGQVDVLTSRRQPGSSFKPFVYAAAFNEGYNPSTVLFDVETDFGGNYKPQNFNGEFQGPVSLRQSLNESLNIPAIKATYLATPEKVLGLAASLGIKYEGDAREHGVALGVGVAEVEPLSHINAFQVFAGDGSWYEPSAILEVRDSEGTVLEKTDFEKYKHKGLDPEVSALVRHILTDEATRPTTDGFDWNNLLQLEKYNNGSKTGTSNRQAENPEFNEEKPEDEEDNPKLITVPGDSWTVGFTPHLVTGVWVGNNRGEPMKPGATGLAVAAPIWKRFNDDAHKLLEADPKKGYDEPTPLEVRKVNKYSGHLASDLTPPKLVKEEYFASFAVPTELDQSVQQMEIDKISGLPASPYTPHYSKTLKYVLTLDSILPDRPNWQGPVEEWIKEHPRFMSSLGTIMDQPLDEDSPERRTLSRWDTRKILPNDRQLSDVHNLYTHQNAPKVKILSPRNGTTIAPGAVEVQISALARYGMKTVEFYLDDQLVAETSISPFTGRFDLPPTSSPGAVHVLKVVALDRLLHMGTDEIEVSVDFDQTGPDIQFLGPIGHQRIPINTTVQVSARITDYGSAVDQVQFFLDETELSPDPLRPFSTQFVADGSLGRHTLKIMATDVHGNKNQKSIPIDFERERLVVGETPLIQDIRQYQSSASVDLFFPNPEKIELAELIVEKTNGGEIVFHKTLAQVSKFAQIQIPRNFEGRAEIKLITKWKGDNEPFVSPKKEMKW